MTKSMSAATTADFEELQVKCRRLADCTCAQKEAQAFIDRLFERFSDSLVLLRLFMTIRYDELPEADKLFVDGRGRDTNTSPLIHAATPIFTLLATRGAKPEWNDRRKSQRFRCIPLASTGFVASLSMLSRQFESVGFDLRHIDDWETKVSVTGRADAYRGMLFIGNSAADRDEKGRMIVPMQEFVAENGVKSTLGFGGGYAGHPTLVTLFAFTREELTEHAMEPVTSLLEAFVSATESVVGQGHFFAER